MIIDAIDYNLYPWHKDTVQKYNVSNVEYDVHDFVQDKKNDQFLDQDAILMHNILGHTSETTITNSKETKSIIGLPKDIPKFLKNYKCVSCERGTSHKKRTHPGRDKNTSHRPLQRIHMDVIPVPSNYQLNIKGNNYEGSESIKELLNANHFLLAVDEYTRRLYFIPMMSMKAEDIHKVLKLFEIT